MNEFSFSLSSVPQFLRGGELFRTFSGCGDSSLSERGGITVCDHVAGGVLTAPSKCCKFDTVVQSIDDANLLFCTLQYWIVDDIPLNLLKFLLCNSIPEKDIQQICNRFGRDFLFLQDVPQHLRKQSHLNRMIFCAERGFPDIVQKLHLLKPIKTAEEQCLVCSAAARSRTNLCLRMLHEQLDYAWSTSTTVEAASCGGLECLRYAYDNGCPPDPNTGYFAIQAGSVDCLRVAHEHGCLWNASTCSAAAMRDSLVCLQYAYQHGCPWDADTLLSALCANSFACFQFAREHGCSWDSAIMVAIVARQRMQFLSYAHEHGCPWDAAACATAAGKGCLECLQYLHEHGCPWDADTCSAAAEGGHLDCLRYAHEHGCPCFSSVCGDAAGGGQLSCLQYLHEQGVTWDATVCRNAALNGHLDCLQYAHEHGCPWDETTGLWALHNENINCLLYLLENKCPMDTEVRNKAKSFLQQKQQQNQKLGVKTSRAVSSNSSNLTHNLKK
jgi:hypothetical protein